MEDVSGAGMTKAHATMRTRPSASSRAWYARRAGGHLIAAGVMRFAKALYPTEHAFLRDLTATAAGSIAGSAILPSAACHGGSNVANPSKPFENEPQNRGAAGRLPPAVFNDKKIDVKRPVLRK